MDYKNNFGTNRLKLEFIRRKERNSRYSLRAFSKYLGIEAPSLSAILKGKRGVPKHKMDFVVKKLELSPADAKKFRMSFIQKPQIQEDFQYDSETDSLLKEDLHFKVISEWEHAAILSLMDTPQFKKNPKWIAERLGITVLKVRQCLENLLAGQLISETDTSLEKTQRHTFTTEDVPSEALRKARREDLVLADRALDHVDLQLRDMSAVTMTLNREDISQLKKDIRQFRKKIMNYAERQDGDDVYRMSIQLFPITKIDTKEKT